MTPRNRVGIVCDLVEEEWPSMDVVAAQLLTALKGDRAGLVDATELRPRMVRRASRIPGASASPLARNADRLANRFGDYPRWLQRRAGQHDVFHIIDHSYAQLVHVLPAQRTVVTCHDLDTFRSVLEPEHERRGRAFRAMTRRILTGMQKAAVITCDSAATRDAILGHRLVPEDRLEIVHLGVSPSMTPQAAVDVDRDVDQRLGPRRPDQVEILHVGSTIRRKRIDVLLRTFATVRERHPHCRLIRIGGALTSEQADLALRLRIPPDAILSIPFMDHARLAGAYRRVAVVLQPSDAEGFGLPVAEAMACGTPVVASDLAVLREVGGDAAVYCPIADIPAWSDAVARLLRMRLDDPAGWAAMRELSVRQASRFSWSEFARRMTTVYQRLRDA